jgi:hypothetical protein
MKTAITCLALAVCSCKAPLATDAGVVQTEEQLAVEREVAALDQRMRTRPKAVTADAGVGTDSRGKTAAKTR